MIEQYAQKIFPFQMEKLHKSSQSLSMMFVAYSRVVQIQSICTAREILDINIH